MIINCDNCNKEFEKSQPKINRCKNHFCSKGCFGLFRRLDLVGKFYDQLEVIECEGMNKNSTARFKCRCSCGRIVSVLGSVLKRGDATKCVHCARRNYKDGEVGGQYFSNLRWNSINKRKIAFEITQKDVNDKFAAQGRRCVYTGLELFWQDGSYGERGTASVDRIDSKIGYTRENIQVVHKIINNMKWDYDEKYFLDMYEKVSIFDGKFTPILDYVQTKKHVHWRGCGEISKRYWSKIQKGARQRRNMEFNITIEYAWQLFLDQGGMCYLTGIPIIFEPSCKREVEKTASLDRVDSSKGYILGNVAWVHKDINEIKINYSKDDFISWSKMVINYYKGKNSEYRT